MDERIQEIKLNKEKTKYKYYLNLKKKYTLQ